jgi:tungstate transport system ATP-binding protein
MSDLPLRQEPLISLSKAAVVVDGKSLLVAIDLTICEGESVVVLGPNGAGKSTLLKLCNSIISPSFGGVKTLPLPEQSLVFQRPALLQRTVLDNVRFVLSIRGVVEPSCTDQARRALAACNLSEAANQQARSLSGGEQQRLALARAWACKPRLLLADEPTANLAPAAMREVERLLRAVQSDGTTLVLTTHNIAQARRLASRIVFLDGGRIAEDRPAADFFASPRSAAAQLYLEGESL